jgi:hypothetical protein
MGQIQQLAELVTTRVTVEDRLTQRFSGQLGDLSMTFRLEAVILLGPSLQEARIEASDERLRTAVIVLPPPAPISIALDLKHSGFESIEWSGLWWMFPDEQARTDAQWIVMNEAERRASEANLQNAIGQSRRHTEDVIQRFGDSVGWALRVRWQE